MFRNVIHSDNMVKYNNYHINKNKLIVMEHIKKVCLYI